MGVTYFTMDTIDNRGVGTTEWHENDMSWRTFWFLYPNECYWMVPQIGWEA